MRQIVFMLLLAILLSGLLVSKNLNIGANYSGYYSDNIFMNASLVTDYISQLQADIHFTIKKIKVYLKAYTDIYADNPDFNSFHIEPAVEFSFSLKGRNAILLSLSYPILNYKELYTDFNYSGPQFQTSVKLYTTSQTLLKAGYLFQSRNYSNYESFDFRNHAAFVEINRFFNTQTKVRLQAGINYRHYPHIVEDYDFGDNYNYYNNRKSHGKMSNQSPWQYLRYKTMSVPNVYGLLHISQGIGTRLGITGKAEFRKNFRGLDDAETLIKNSYIIYPYNDNYLWDGTRFSLGVNMVLFNEFSVEGLMSYFDKNYPGIYIMDVDGNVIEPATERKDSMLIYNLKLSKKIRQWDLFANVSYGDNRSNDDYFFYKLLTISAGIGYYF